MGVPRASSRAFTTEMECFLVDRLLLSIEEAPESSEPPLDIDLDASLPFSLSFGNDNPVGGFGNCSRGLEGGLGLNVSGLSARK